MTTIEIEKIETDIDENGEESELYKIQIGIHNYDWGVNYYVENLYIEATRFNDIENDAVSSDFPQCNTHPMLNVCRRRAYWEFFALYADSGHEGWNGKFNRSEEIPGQIRDIIRNYYSCDEHRLEAIEEIQQEIRWG